MKDPSERFFWLAVVAITLALIAIGMLAKVLYLLDPAHFPL